MKMLVQLHHQFHDHTEFVAQREIENDYPEFAKFFEEVKDRHPLPSGAIWVAVPEDSIIFIKGDSHAESYDRPADQGVCQGV